MVRKEQKIRMINITEIISNAVIFISGGLAIFLVFYNHRKFGSMLF